ncbi:amidohydrolase family protein [Halocatena salina]|uniref:Amidohydrolase family protein n=1 Tax=Halocatena salina TaxID=2934340 RepID=A0A8U0A442_9EURY|nr:amidohydrolase family protein [Halocatena salina]UPM43794.1 amidohydrolase family protein [Halocatena salina]
MSTQLTGTILRGREFEPVEGRVVIDDGHITAVEETTTDSTDIILPAFVNAHTHIGDSIAKEAGGGLSLDELVAPPDGLKHRLLRAASDEELTHAMARSLRFMQRSGTGAFLEFREGGTAGVQALERALADDDLDLTAVVFGRESIEAMEISDGFGASGARDSDFEAERKATRNADKPFAIHAGERDPDDIDPAFDLDPELLVHMVHAQPDHFERLEETETPVAVCPRSNLVTGVGLPPIRQLLDHTTVALGTDNVMLNSPSMFREMEFACKFADVTARETLRMATVAGADAVGLNCGLIAEDRNARLLVLDGDSDNLVGARDPVRAVVRRAGVSDVKRVVLT